MAKKKYRFVIIGTGSLASIAARCVQGRDNLELVGIWAHEETDGHKIGMDAGLLDGDTPCGVLVTGNEEDLWALKPDAALVVLNLDTDLEKRDRIVGGWYEKCLSRGINVVSTSIGTLINPAAHHDQAFVARLDSAAKKGGASLYVTGEEPGYGEHLAALLATCSNTIKTITTSEIFDYQTSASGDWMINLFGFAKPKDYVCLFEKPGFLEFSCASPIHDVVQTLGYKLDRIEMVYEKILTEKDIPCGVGSIPAGTVGAVRWRLLGIVEGKSRVILEHVNRVGREIAPEWPQAAMPGTIRVKIEGDPNLQLDFSVGTAERPGELAYDGMVMTAMRVSNAIPYVCEAPAGIVTFHDMPLTVPASALRSEATYVEHTIYRG
ncbi:MAG: hypothetical protein LBL26_14635 [Peptococcaceae bacterium]|nr:hypothetical protein [Peptococcaceae bacterium]